MVFYTPKKKKCNKLVEHEIPFARNVFNMEYIAETGWRHDDTLYLNDTYFTQMSILGQVSHLKKTKNEDNN